MKRHEHAKCYIFGCKNSVCKVMKLVNKAGVCDFFGVQIKNTEPTCSDEDGTALCMEHYGALYRHLNPFNKKCRTCDKTLNDLSKSRKCPEPALIQRFLQQNTEFSGQITTDDRVSYARYRAHLIIIKHTHNTTNSTDADLSILIDRIKSEMCATSDVHTVDQAISYVADFSAVYVGEALWKQNALLLPDVYDYFHNKLLEITKLRDIVLNQDLHIIASLSWLRSHLSSLLEHHMAYRCSVKRYGTVLYRYGGDPVHALNVSLGQAQNQTLKIPAVGKNDSNDFQTTLSETCLALNAECHACIEKTVKEDVANPHRIENIDVDKFINDLDPDVWKAVCLITQPLSSRAKNSTDNSNIRKIRRLFCICTLLFTTNSQCSFSLHTLLADAIETCRGSSRLMRLLNRVGACASADTHARYVQYRVQKYKEEGPMSGYRENAFTLASTDNLDFVHSHARVYCGKQQSSWHGTTIQIVQPQPSKLVNTSQEKLVVTDSEAATHAEATTSSNTHLSPTRHPDTPAAAMETLETRYQACLSKRSYSIRSPVNSPGKRSPLPKRKRRMRTGTEGASRNLHEQFHSSTSTQMDYQQQTPSQKPTLTIKDFQLTDKEDKALLELAEMSTQYVLQKVASSERNKMIIQQSSNIRMLQYNLF